MSTPLLSRKIDWIGSLPFLAIHGIALWVLISRPWSWSAWGLVAGSYYLRMFAITAGFHRYFSHKCFQCGRIFQFALAFLGGASAQRGALWWAHHHRHHHKFSDLQSDIHSPVQDSFFWSHVGWVIGKNSSSTDYSKITDFAKFRELVWLNKFHLVPPVIYAVVLAILFGEEGLWWGFFVSTVFLWHGTFTINSLAHLWGTKSYENSDESRNNFILALLTMGEGWHNNHHFYQKSAKQGHLWWEIDISYLVLKLFSHLNIVWDIKGVPKMILKKNRHYLCERRKRVSASA